MLDRRRFLATAAAAAAAPGAALAHSKAQGAAPETIDPVFLPQYVRIKDSYEAGQILVMPREHFLYHIIEPGTAVRYGVGVGRAGLQFQGTATIDVKKEWPTWRPTDEMIEREPERYARFIGNTEAQPGGPDNPLGARALYLFQDGRDTFYRIHGTTEPNSIGRSVSNGCIRMLNEHVTYLYEQVPIGTVVTVI